jgi:hypothetical protein
MFQRKISPPSWGLQKKPRRNQHKAVPACDLHHAASCLTNSKTLKMEKISYETSIDFQWTTVLYPRRQTSSYTLSCLNCIHVHLSVYLFIFENCHHCISLKHANNHTSFLSIHFTTITPWLCTAICLPCHNFASFTTKGRFFLFSCNVPATNLHHLSLQGDRDLENP